MLDIVTKIPNCNAGWFELNISAPDNQVSACCYYHGAKDPWDNESKSIFDYWNSVHMQELRRVNVLGVSPSGCSNCHFYTGRANSEQYFPEFLGRPENSTLAGSRRRASHEAVFSEKQRENWRLAVEEFKSGTSVLKSRPLRVYVNFGFACNLSCIHCHQVPRRNKNRRQVLSDVLMNWREDFQYAMEVCVIGGEPFALPEAVKFIRAFVEDPALKHTRLSIFTNGTLHHKHMATLAQKDRLDLVVSLDSIEEAFEFIRVDGSWERVEKNIVDFIQYGREHNKDWRLWTSCALMKAAITSLPKFAQWSVSHKIPTLFYELTSARGVEKAVAGQDYIAHPGLVRDIPGWERYFDEAVEIFEKSDVQAFLVPANSLRAFKQRVVSGLAAMLPAEGLPSSVKFANDWKALFGHESRKLSDSVGQFVCENRPVIQDIGGLATFVPTHLNDHLATDFIDLPPRSDEGVWLRIECTWPAGVPSAKRIDIYIQDQSWKLDWNVGHADELDSGRKTIHYIKLPRSSEHVRLYMWTDNGEKSGVLPTSIRMEARTAAAELVV